MEDLKDTFVKSRVPKIFTGAVNIRQPGPGSEFYSLREYFDGDSFRAINWSAYARSGKLMVNERERDAVSDIILIVDSRAVSETGPVSRNALVYSTRAAASLAQYFLGRRDSVGLITYGDEVVSVDRDTRDFDVTVLSPSSLEFEFDAKRLDRTGYEVLKTERDVLISELRGLGVNIMDWEPDMLLSTALAGARGF